MNILRGTSLKGLSNMTFCDYRDELFHFRPLIGLQKRYIQELCDVEKIPYFLDPTNKNSSLTIRNALRNDVFPQMSILSPQNKRYESWSMIYSQIEKNIGSTDSNRIRLHPLAVHKNRGATYCYELLHISRNIKNLTEADRIYVFQRLGVWKNV